MSNLNELHQIYCYECRNLRKVRLANTTSYYCMCGMERPNKCVLRKDNKGDNNK